MTRKLLALLTALLLALPCMPALAETSLTSRLFTGRILAAIGEALDANELTYERNEEYSGCFFSLSLSEASVLGDAVYVDAYAYDDGMLTICTYSEPVPEARQDGVIRLCNHFNASLYLGKLYVNPGDGALCYELFLPLNAADIRPCDQEQIDEFIWVAYSIMDDFQEYFAAVIQQGETADNVFAMWQADQN